jgi:hypothetical protein
MGKPARHFEKDDMGAHARLYESIVNSPAWLALPFSTRALYVQLRVKLKQTNNGNIDATAAALKHSASVRRPRSSARCASWKPWA